ncbi:MAG TPA: YdeI/OmpD-associated family protein [Planctomycetota bacterium]|nr:YdeI/OmpD-associated family protein [Planctomycetota bacterium]
MGRRDKRIDAYIAKAAPFAQPILTSLREQVHAACPDVEETLKWSHPSFEYKGILCGMAAFKKHAVFGFWKHDLVVGEHAKAREAMGSFGCLTKLSDLPPKKAFAGYVRTAMRLNDEGVVVKRQKTRPRKAVAMHPELRAAMAGSAKARATFEAFPPSQKRDYLEWVAEAKGDDTRARRIQQAVEWMAQGKRRNWKYETC